MFKLEPNKPIFSPEIFGNTINIMPSVITQWIVILILGIGAFLLTRNLKLKPGKVQAGLEKVYESIKGIALDTMGKEYENFLPYIGTLMIYLLVLNFTGLIGFQPATQDISVTAAFATITFLVVNLNAIKKNGLIGYGEGLLHPFWPMLPINIMERFVLPLALALRLYGNMLAATIILELIYHVLGSISPIAQLGIPVPVHLYFDIFDGTIQMIVFSMLTMINIKVTAEH